jgi:hypothetical protein
MKLILLAAGLCWVCAVSAQELQVREEFMERAPRLRRFRIEMIEARPVESDESLAQVPMTKLPVRFYLGFEGPPGWRIESLRMRVEGRPWRSVSFGEGSGSGLDHMFWASLNLGRLPIGLKSVFAEARIVAEEASWPFGARPVSRIQAAFVPFRLETESSQGAFLLQAFESKPWRLHSVGLPR